MDVMSPELLWIDGSCYRINPTTDNALEEQQLETTDTYVEEDLYGDDEEDDYNIVSQDNGRFKTSFHVANAFRGLIIGAKGVTKKRIETETKTTIDVPRIGDGGHVQIFGVSRQSVATARRRIELIVLGGRHKQQSTHFICIPVNTKSIQEKFNQFKKEILKESPAIGVKEKMFNSAEKLHLTLCVLSLMDNEDRCLVAELLQNCKKSIIEPTLQQFGEIKFKISGVEIMNDDPGSVNVLYGKVNCAPLQKLSDEIVDYFVAKGVIQRQYDRVKLHMTLMQTEEQTERFDARDILQRYANYDFGTVQMKEIHLSQRFTTACDGFYEATTILKLEK